MYYVNQPGYYYYPVYNGVRHYQSYRQFPPVDPNFFYQSANETKKLMTDVAIVLEKLATSKEFDSELMEAAQSSDMEEVKRLIYSLGITSEVDIHFNPDGLRLEFRPRGETSNICSLTIAMRWR